MLRRAPYLLCTISFKIHGNVRLFRITALTLQHDGVIRSGIMCGRYDLFPGEFSDLRIPFNLDEDLPDFKPSYNIAPGKDVPVIVRQGDRNVVKLMRWGLVPSWAQDSSIGNQVINARCETLDRKPSFKQLLGSRRCLIPTDGFYDWARVGRGKIPMPLILEPLAAGQWLDPNFTSFSLLSVLMQPFTSELMEAYEVSRLVNDPKNYSPACIASTVPEPPLSLF